MLFEGNRRRKMKPPRVSWLKDVIGSDGTKIEVKSELFREKSLCARAKPVTNCPLEPYREQRSGGDLGAAKSGRLVANSSFYFSVPFLNRDGEVVGGGWIV